MTYEASEGASEVSEAYQNQTAFREAERKYKWFKTPVRHASGKQMKHMQRSMEDVDLTDVVDIRNLAQNTAVNNAALRRIPVPRYSSSHDSFHEKTEQCCYAFDAIPGLYLIPNAVDEATQESLCRAAVLEYGDSSRYPNVLSTHVNHPVETTCYRPPMRWGTFGFSYQWTTKTYDKEHYAPFPCEVERVMNRLSKAVFEAEQGDEKLLVKRSEPAIYEPQSGIVNYFPVGTTMMCHQDNSENALSQPLLSLSLGASCIFLMGTTSRDDVPTAFRLRSGDLAAFAGPARLCFHSVSRVLDDCPDHLTISEDQLSQEELARYEKYCYHGNGVHGPPVERGQFSETQAERYWRLSMRHMRININARQVYREPCRFLFEA